MSRWNSFSGWMDFPNLDASVGLTHSYTISYKITDSSDEHWTRRFIDFKDGKRDALFGGGFLLADAVPKLISGIGLDVAKTALVPALSSDETVASANNALSVMASICAKKAGVKFLNDAITKNAHTPFHKAFNANNRQVILDNANYMATLLTLNKRHLV